MKVADGACEAKTTSGNQVTITYTATFAAAPFFSASVYIKSGTRAGSMALISSQTVAKLTATLSLQAWDGLALGDLDDGVAVQVSWMAIDK